MMVVSIQPVENLAIVGMEVSWAGCDGLDAFERMVYEGIVWTQAGIEAGMHIPLAPGESLLHKVARGALQDMSSDALNPGTRAAAPRVAAPRLAALVASAAAAAPSWPWAESITDISAEANPLIAALDHTRRLLEDDQADAVVFAADSGLPELGADAPLANSAAYGFDRDIHGWRFGEGAGAVVLMRADRARAEGRRIYAVLRGAASIGSSASATGKHAALPIAPTVESVRTCCRNALEQARISPEQVGYLETFASGVDALDGIEIAGMVQAYRQPKQDLTTALGSAQANTGYLAAAAGLAGLVRTALCLHHRHLPGMPGWNAPKLPALWRGAPFYVPGESRPWFESTTGTGRLAGLNILGRGGSFAHLILAEAVDQPVRANRVLAQGGFTLFPLVAPSLEILLEELADLRQSLAFATDLNALAAEWYQSALEHEIQPLGLAIVGSDHETLEREISLALRAVPAAFEKGTEWQTPLGSYFTPEPVGRKGGVALVYPGAFNSYPGVGRDLFRLFPDLHQRSASISSHMGQVMRERLLYPRSLAAISKEEMAARETALLADPIAMLISGASMSILYTYILQERFALRPQAAFGYSLGENSMMFATGVWGQGDAASAQLAASDTFRVRLAGPQLAIREHWGLPGANGNSQGPLWSNYLVMASPEKVEQAIAQEPHVYLTHINTPRQVVIGGDPEGCKRVVAALHCSSLQAPFDYALHCQPMRSEFGALAKLHDWPVEQVPDLQMYSAADYGPVAFERAEISQKIAHMLTTPLDFPRLVRQVYADGARVFIEAGAGSNCARWVDESLKGLPHLALSLNRRGTDDYSTLVRTLARLHCHRVPMNLAALYRPAFRVVNP